MFIEWFSENSILIVNAEQYNYMYRISDEKDFRKHVYIALVFFDGVHVRKIGEIYT